MKTFGIGQKEYFLLRNWPNSILRGEEARYDSDVARIDELEDLYDEDRITDEEYFELCSLHAYWSKASQCCPHYWIEEYEMN